MKTVVVITRDNIMDYNRTAENLGSTTQSLWTPSMEKK